MQLHIDEDTICAISTPAGVGGIAVARVSGRDAVKICDKIWRGKSLDAVASHTAHLGKVIDQDGNELDEAVATVFRGPKSFTGEDVVELAVHGSVYIQRELIAGSGTGSWTGSGSGSGAGGRACSEKAGVSSCS